MISFEKFFEGIANVVENACRFQASSWAIASPILVEIDDLRQEVMLKLWNFWKRGGEIDPDRSVKIFISVLVANQARSMVKRQAEKHQLAVAGLFNRYSTMAVKMGDPTNSEAPLWDERIYPGVDYAEAMDILKHLPKPDLDFIELLVNYDYPEIAKKLNQSTGSIYAQAARLREKIKGILYSESDAGAPTLLPATEIPGAG